MSRRPRKALPAARDKDPAVLLIALRDRLADEIDRTEDPRELAALTRQILDVAAQLRAARPAESEKVTPIDSILRRRQANA